MTALIMKYEAGLLEEDEIEDLFQMLVDNGMAWRLQGHYGREAMRLLKSGRIHS